MRVAIFASGNGTNFEVLTKHFQAGDIPGELALLFCNHPDAPVMKRAERLGVPAVSFTVKSCGGKQAYEEKVLSVLKERKIDFIALAGYLRVVGPTILDHYDHRIVNLHPAWLPEYPGLDSIATTTATRLGLRSTTSTPAWIRAQSLPSSTCRSCRTTRLTPWKPGSIQWNILCIRKFCSMFLQI